MRNLKKLLALVLAMVMAFSLMLSASAVDYKDYTDKDQITPQFTEAVQVLSGLKVFQGDEAGNFKPGESITRASVAAIIYRMVTGDVTDSRVNIYADYGNFVDVKPGDWFAGYVGYCANAEYIKGHNGYFRPNDTVTGYEALAMILRAVGYDQNHEFEGAAWQTHVAHLAQELKITENVKNANFENTLTVAARRDVVADLLFQTAATVPTVTYTSALQYNDRDQVLNGNKNTTLGQKTFGLFCDGNWVSVDKWGTPGYYWVKGGSFSSYDPTTGMPVYNGNLHTNQARDNFANVIATITPAPTKVYDDGITRECDVAHDIGFSGSQSFRLFVNDGTPGSAAASVGSYMVVATDTVTKVGGQGRETKFWKDVKSNFTSPKTMPNWCTMVDTFLAKVTKVEPEVLDAAGHQMIKAKLTMIVYDRATNTEAGADALSRDIIVEKPSGNWEFVKGNMVLLNAHTSTSGWDANDQASAHTGSTDNEAAFEAERILLKNGKVAEYATNITKVEPVLGKQTTVYWNQGKHNVDNVDKLDQLDLHLDVAGSTVNTTFAWYYDAKGNLIGIGDAPNNTQYGVITSIYSSFIQGDSQTDGNAVAIANVKYADGTEGTVTIDRFLVNSGELDSTDAWTYGALADDKAAHITLSNVGTTMAEGTGAAADNSPASTTGSAELLPTYDTAAINAMTATPRVVSRIWDAVQAGYLHIAPVAGVNATSEKTISADATPWGNNGTSTGGSYGIIRGNLFKFVSSADGYMTAIEVAGANNNNLNEIYDGHNNYLVDITVNSDNVATLSKNFAYLTLKDAAGSEFTIRMDNDTKIMVRGCTIKDTANKGEFDKATNTIDVYDGIDELPASIIVPDKSEVDWVDIDRNGIVDVLYVYGVKKGATTYGLFYYNGGAGQWNGNDSDGSGWLRGWLDGKQTDLTFNDKVQFDRVQESSINYGGHLFAVKLFDGEVESLLGSSGISSSNKDLFLIDTTPTVGVPNTTAVAVDALLVGSLANKTTGITTDGTVTFVTGITGGNDYSTTANDTSAIWLHDDPASVAIGNHMNVVYNSGNNTIEVWCYTINADGTKDLKNNSGGTVDWGTTVLPGADVADAVYNLSGSSAFLGDMIQFVNMTGRVNDVTIVFDALANNTVRQVYVTTRPDITPPSQTGSYASSVAVTGANVRTITGSGDDLIDAIAKGAPNTVIRGTGADKANIAGETKAAAFNDGAYDLKLRDASNPANWPDYLFFPYSVTVGGTPGTTRINVTFTITDSTGEVVYRELGSPTDGDGGTLTLEKAPINASSYQHVFVVNFDGTANNQAGDPSNRLTLPAGTYHFSITTASNAGGVVNLSSGSFTVER